MRIKYNFRSSFVMAILATCCLWVVTDVAYGVRIWEFGVDAWIDRIKALMVILIGISIAYLFFSYLANVVIERNKDNKPSPGIGEYMLVILFNLILLNISLYVVIYLINETTYRWGEAFMINATAIPIFLLYYTSIRNSVLAERYTEKIVQLEKLKVDRLETELKLLRMQYHPHFLFNALNTIYFLIDEENEEAIESVELLSDLLRYQLYDINTKVTIGQEIDYLQTYIRLQRLRMTERLRFEFSFDPDLGSQKIHPLLFQPLLENAFKYVGGDCQIEVEMRKEGSKVRFMAQNTVAPDGSDKKKGGGIGIDNLRKRLDLLYPDKHQLQIRKDSAYFTVNLLIDLSE